MSSSSPVISAFIGVYVLCLYVNKLPLYVGFIRLPVDFMISLFWHREGRLWGGYRLLVLGRGMVLPVAEENKGGVTTAGIGQKAPGITFISRAAQNPQ